MLNKSLVILLIVFMGSISNLAFAQSARGSAEADVTLTPAGDFKAKVSDVTGHAIIKGDSVQAENVIVKLKGITTGLSLRDKHAREKYLEVQKYPEMILVKAIGKNGKGKGRIRYRGVQKDVQGTYSVKDNFLTAVFPLKLSDFKITGIKYMGVGVDDEIRIQVKLPVKSGS